MISKTLQRRSQKKLRAAPVEYVNKEGLKLAVLLNARLEVFNREKHFGTLQQDFLDHAKAMIHTPGKLMELADELEPYFGTDGVIDLLNIWMKDIKVAVAEIERSKQ